MEVRRTSSSDEEPLPFQQRLTLYKRLLAHDHNRAWFRFLNAVVRGGLSGACLRGGLHLVSFLFGLIVKWRKQQAARSLNFWSKLQDTARYAAFLATYSGSFVAVDEGIAAVFGKRRWGPGCRLLEGHLVFSKCTSSCVHFDPAVCDLAGQQPGGPMQLVQLLVPH